MDFIFERVASESPLELKSPRNLTGFESCMIVIDRVFSFHLKSFAKVLNDFLAALKQPHFATFQKLFVASRQACQSNANAVST